MIATGGGDQSNLLVRGSEITAGQDVLLAADHDVILESAQNTAEQHSSSKSSSAAVGVAITYGSSGFAAGITASASGARGKADGTDTSQTNSHVTAGKTATVISGHDTTLKGAVLSADQVVADVGHDLTIESQQDTSTYASKNKSMGGSVTVGYGFSASASYASSKVNGDYASVIEQSGIQAGDGGFQIKVGGNTDLKGGVIASTQAAVDAGANRLQTGTLTASELVNHSSYSATGISLSGGYSYGGTAGKASGTEASGQSGSTVNNGQDWSWQNYGTGSSGAAAGISQKSGHDRATTASGLSGGTLVITDEAGQQARTGESVEQRLASLNREVVTGDSANGLVKAWDGQKLQQQVEAGAQITATFGQQASRAVGDYAQKQMDTATSLRLQAGATSDPDQKAQLIAQADQLESQWGESGSLRVLAHTVIGGLTGGVEGAAGAAGGTLTAPKVAEALKEAGVAGGLADALTALASTTVGAAAGGPAGSAAAANEVSNNYLTHQQIAQLQQDMSVCALTGTCKEVADKYLALSKSNDAALQQTCTSDPAGSACQSGIREALNYAGDQGWKTYSAAGDARTAFPLASMDADIERSRKVALDLVFGDRQVYGAINDIEPRADFFGAMYQQTGAVWFEAAEDQSRTNLSGPLFELGVLYNFGKEDVMQKWRAAAGNEIMKHGYAGFYKIYSNPQIDPSSWSIW